MDPSAISQIGLPTLLLGAGIVGIIINALILMYIAKHMDIPDVGFGKCFIASLVPMIANAITSLTLRNPTLKGDRSFIISSAIGVIISTIFIKFILNTDLVRAFLTYIMMLVVTIIVLFGCCFFAGGLPVPST